MRDAKCFRVLNDGVCVCLLKSEAWRLTRSLIESGWTITSSTCDLVAASTHQMNMAAAASSIFITCRKRDVENRPLLLGPASAAQASLRVREAVAKIKELKL